MPRFEPTHSVFVGRQEELAAFSAAFDRASGGATAFVAISGEAGIGKTRFVTEAIARAGERGVAMVGHCFQHVHTPLQPFREIFRQLGHTPRTATEVTELLNEEPACPRILAIEDLQWADAATLEVLEQLAVSRKDMRLLVVMTIRIEPERSHAFARTLARMRSAGLMTIRFDPLTRGETIELIRTLAGSRVPHAAIERITRLAEGNPLFVEELVRTKLDGKGDASIDPTFESVRPTVLERLYRLSEKDQRVLTVAAVVGTHFDATLVARLLRRSLESVLAALRRARNEQLVREFRDGSSIIAFHHALFCDVIYRELLAVEAIRFHARVAEALQRAPDVDARVAEIAYHWSEAKSFTKALPYHLKAGDAAAAVSSFEDAARSYDGALRALELSKSNHPEYSRQYAEISEKRAYAWYAAGIAERTDELFAAALTAYEALGERSKVIEMLLFISRQSWNDARAPVGYERALDVARLAGNDDPAMRDFGITMAASYAVHLARPEEALALLERIGEHAPSELAARRNDTAAIAKYRLGDFAGSAEAAARGRAAADTSDDPDMIVRTYSNSADLSAASGLTQETLSHWERAFNAAKSGGYIGRMTYAALGYAAALIDAGEISRARELHALSLDRVVGNAAVVMLETAVGSLLRALAGWSGALPVPVEEALELAIRSGEPARIAQVGAPVAFAAIAEERFDDARGLLDRSIAVIDAPHFTEPLLLLGALYGRAGRDRAVTLLDALASRKEAALARLMYDVVLALKRTGSFRRTALRQVAHRCEEMRRPLIAALALTLANDAGGASGLLARIGASAFSARLEERQTLGRRKRASMTLTPRELEIAALIAEGASNRAISERLQISERTVQVHVGSILQQFGVPSRWLITPEILAQRT